MQAIADHIDVHKSTVSRELQRGSTQRTSDLNDHQVYFLDAGQRIYETNRSHCGATYKFVTSQPFLPLAAECIQERYWSPDVLVGVAKKNGWYHLYENVVPLY